jgi:hypothetical protein
MLILLNKHEAKKLMTAIDNLTAAIGSLTTAIDTFTPGTASGATDAQIQAAADAVTVQTNRIIQLTQPSGPPATTTPPAPATNAAPQSPSPVGSNSNPTTTVGSVANQQTHG